ncbi:hypothetical protein LTR62_006692 [Meristemomyces frigidus]|uniref:Uncharacterized protein n=1 Tax=Meristemomyces frigidus TaxID=1508187 RepID=A0AAN7TVQ4_9PEZI|nr:hypothetical protein LTR62_006692 [Meristemomyces frigidus]
MPPANLTSCSTHLHHGHKCFLPFLSTLQPAPDVLLGPAMVPRVPLSPLERCLRRPAPLVFFGEVESETLSSLSSNTSMHWNPSSSTRNLTSEQWRSDDWIDGLISPRTIPPQFPPLRPRLQRRKPYNAPLCLRRQKYLLPITTLAPAAPFMRTQWRVETPSRPYHNLEFDAEAETMASPLHILASIRELLHTPTLTAKTRCALDALGLLPSPSPGPSPGPGPSPMEMESIVRRSAANPVAFREMNWNGSSRCRDEEGERTWFGDESSGAASTFASTRSPSPQTTRPLRQVAHFSHEQEEKDQIPVVYSPSIYSQPTPSPPVR